MESVDILSYSSEDSREIVDPEKINQILYQALMFGWKFDYLVMAGKKISSLPAELTFVSETQKFLTITGDFSRLNSEDSRNIYFRASNGGLSIVFQSELIDCAEFFAVKECNFCLPESLRLSQQRSAVRINFTDLQDIPVAFHVNIDNLFEGNVIDLSETGAKTKFYGNLLDHIDLAEIVSDCHLILPDESVIESRVQVMGCLYDELADTSYVRCRFLQLHNNSELQLRQFIFHALSQIQDQQPSL
ncbi:MAG: hypothetical protein GKR91_15295 [Pseudomonadales bacterium]|nr:hypothetical protein [Pseudomonadales bacterium]